MSLLSVDFVSTTLQMGTRMHVLLPDDVTAPPVLYLLHGLGGDDTQWLNNSAVARYATQRGLAVVMPAVQRGYYVDGIHGLPYWTFLSDELPRQVARMLAVSSAPRDTYVAGLSMGGYGAMLWALRHPDRFAAAVSVSGALGLALPPDEGGVELEPRLRDQLFGGRPIAGTEWDPIALLGRTPTARLPRLSVVCGLDDFVLPGNRRFLEVADAAGIRVDRAFRPGAHDWDYWGGCVEPMLDWLLADRPVPQTAESPGA